MKKQIAYIFLVATMYSSFAQKKDLNIVFVSQNTIMLKATECTWIIRPLVRNLPKPSSKIKKSIPKLLLDAIEKGKLKAVDSWTEKIIPGKKIYTWGTTIDTIDVSNGSGVFKYDVVHNKRVADDIHQIKICQNWYFDIRKNKLFATIKWIEFMEQDRIINRDKERNDADDVPFCRIYY